MRRESTHRWRAGFIGTLLPLFLTASLFSEPIVVKSVRGNAEIHRAKSQANRWRVLQKGAPVKPGDTVRTGQNARVELKVDDGSRVVLGSKSRVQVAQSSPSRIFNLAAGRVKSFVKKLRPQSKFEIRTPLAAAAVRGTVFEVGFDEEANAGFLEVNRGVVSLSQGDRAMDVRPGDRVDFLKDVPLGEAPSRAGQMSTGPSPEDTARQSMKREVGLGMTKEMVMAAAAEEIRRAEYQEGKTLLDVNGNRVRLEEYIIRNPAEAALPDHAFKLVALNERDTRFDYFYYIGQFNKELPTDLSVALNDVRGRLNAQPDYYLTEYEIGMSNTQDAIIDRADGGHLVSVAFDGTDYTLTTPDGPTRTLTITADEIISGSGEVLHKVYDPMGDRYYTVTDAQYQAGGGLVPIYNGESDTFQTMVEGDVFYRTNFDNYSHWVLGEGMTISDPAKQTYSPDSASGISTILALDHDATFTLPTDAGGDDTVIALNETPSGEDALHNRITLFYRDGTYESVDTYIISDEGEIGPRSAFAGLTDGLAFKNELLKWNYEQVYQATEFQGRTIDLVVEPKILIKSGLIE